MSDKKVTKKNAEEAIASTEANTHSDEALLLENEALKAEVALLHEQLSKLASDYNQLASTPVKSPGTAVADVQTEPFQVDGEDYQLVVGKIAVRRLGERTALDILADEDTYDALGGLTIKEWLVKNNSKAIKKLGE